MVAEVRSSSTRPALQCSARRSRRPASIETVPSERNRAISSAMAAPLASVDLEQESFKVRGDLDVDARAERGMHLTDGHRSGGEELGEDVVAVGSDDELRDRVPMRWAP